MTSVTLAPVLMTTATLKIGTDNYEVVVKSASLNPTTPVAIFTGINGTKTVGAGVTSWQFSLEHGQDTTTAASLTKFSLANNGTVKPVELTPADGGDGYTFNALVVPGQIGGAVASSEPLSAALTWEVIGQPTPVPAA